MAIETPYDDEIVSRRAPRWAWDIIDETLTLDAESCAFDRSLRDDIWAALQVMVYCADQPELESLPRETFPVEVSLDELEKE